MDSISEARKILDTIQNWSELPDGETPEENIEKLLGKWQVDLSKSDALDTVLDSLSIGRIKRNIVKRAAPTTKIEKSGSNEYDISTSVLGMTTTHKFNLLGEMNDIPGEFKIFGSSVADTLGPDAVRKQISFWDEDARAAVILRLDTAGAIRFVEARWALISGWQLLKWIVSARGDENYIFVNRLLKKM